MDIKNSSKIFNEAKIVMVGGVNSPVRSFKSVGGSPLIMYSGKGEKIFDEDGNAYTDYCLSWGALIYGHGHRNVVLAVRKMVNKGISFGTTTKPEVELAKYIVKNVPSVDMVRFVNSGTEATMSAIRLARGFTKKDMVVKFDGCYHGHADDLLTKAGSGVAQLVESSSQGIPKNHIQNTISLPYNNVTLLEETLNRFKDNIACVIIEPVACNMGVVIAQKEFLKVLRNLTKKYNIVLIFDEIITGFRTNLGGMQAELDIIPDITCLGKIIGGGFPVGAYGGRKDIMEFLAPLGGVYQAGTFSGNPIVIQAGLATLKLLNKEFYHSLNQRGEEFANQVNAYFGENNINAHVAAYKSMLSFRFRKEAVFNYQDAQDASSSQIYSGLFNHLLKSGIYFPPADLETFFICGMHQKKDLNDLLTAIKIFFNSNKRR